MPQTGPLTDKKNHTCGRSQDRVTASDIAEFQDSAYDPISVRLGMIECLQHPGWERTRCRAPPALPTHDALLVPFCCLQEGDIIVDWLRINYAMKDINPVDKISFFSRYNDFESFHISRAKVSFIVPEQYEEVAIRIYTRDPEKVRIRRGRCGQGRSAGWGRQAAGRGAAGSWAGAAGSRTWNGARAEDGIPFLNCLLHSRP